MQAMGPFYVFCTMLSMTKREKKGARLRFTVGSLRNTSRRAGGIDFRHELGLLKAALLYADEVELVSVAGSFMASMEHLGQLPRIERLALMRHLMPIVDPEASRFAKKGSCDHERILKGPQIEDTRRHRPWHPSSSLSLYHQALAQAEGVKRGMSTTSPLVESAPRPYPQRDSFRGRDRLRLNLESAGQWPLKKSHR